MNNDNSVSSSVYHRDSAYYFRKMIFQVILPIVLAIFSYLDYSYQIYSEPNSNNHIYLHLYFYTFTILLFYACIKYILEYIFSICSEDIIFKKEISLDKTINLQLYDYHLDNHTMITIRKVFKIRFSKMKFFEKISAISWYIGLDCPIIIPSSIISKLTDNESNLNDESLLHTTLSNIYHYQPRLYNISPVDNLDGNENLGVSRQVITKTDRNICQMQKELFGKEISIELEDI
jgi:hypothetical protein